MNDLMSKRDPWSFNWLMLSGVLVIVPHIPRIPIWLSLVFFAAMAWRWAVIHRAWPTPNRLVRLALTLFLLVAVFKEFGTLLGREAGTGLIVGLAGLKFLELRTLRDYMMTTFVFYMLIGINFLFDQTLVHGAYLVATVFLTTATLVRLNLPTTDNWRYSLRLAGGMLARALPLMVIMYLLFPRIQGGLWSLPNDAHSGQSGLTDTISAGSLSRLSQSDAPAFRVEFNGKIPPPAQRYWRTLILWQTDGKNWKQGQTPYIAPTHQRATTRGEPIRYTITLEPSGKHWRPALDIPLRPDPGDRFRMGHLVESKNKTESRVRYSLASYTRYNTGALGAYEKRLGLALPRSPGNRVTALVQRWRKESDSDAALVQKALHYFSTQNFRYTLTPPLLGNNPVDQFLFDTRAGYCEHYATSFVTLMRLAGIPSRVVAGYQGGDFNEDGNYLIVRQSDAHAWAEVWLSGKGWTRVDPTAAVAPERIELGIDAIRRLEARGLRPGSLTGDALANLVQLGPMEKLWRQSRMAWDAVNLAWFRWTTGYDIDKQLSLLKRLGVRAPDWMGLILGLFAGVAIFILAMVIGLRRSEQDHDPLLATYHKFEKKLAQRGLVKRPSEGPVDFAHRVVARQPGLRQPVDEITELYVQLRYNQTKQADAGQLGSIREKVRRFRPEKLLADTEA
jgi:transglutaminase-like putative cysteine protease